MDAGRIRRGEAIAGVCAALLFIVMFLGWFGLPEEMNGAPTGVGLAEAPGVDTSLNAWQSYDFTDLLLLVTIVVAVGGAIATRWRATWRSRSRSARSPRGSGS